MAINKDDKEKALEAAMLQIQKQFGKGAIMKLGSEGANMNIEAIPTGSASLDIATGIGGIPRGRIVEIFGPESSVKRPLPCTSLPKRKKWAEKQHLLMRNML